MFSKIKYLILLVTCSLGAGLYFNSTQSSATILIESEESKTKDLTAVFNKIKWISTSDKDIWMMNQSHYGISAKAELWDRLAIVIDKTKTPKIARFYQLSPGPLEWSEDLINHRTPYRASCFICHSNGPRAIRPAPKSVEAQLSLQEKIKLFAWNLRIKTYGRIRYDKIHDQEDITLNPPFHFSTKNENDELKVATCVRCHNAEGRFSRGALVRQQAGTIERLVESGYMPPPGFKMSVSEKRKLRDFLRGF